MSCFCGLYPLSLMLKCRDLSKLPFYCSIKLVLRHIISTVLSQVQLLIQVTTIFCLFLYLVCTLHNLHPSKNYYLLIPWNCCILSAKYTHSLSWVLFWKCTVLTHFSSLLSLFLLRGFLKVHFWHKALKALWAGYCIHAINPSFIHAPATTT